MMSDLVDRIPVNNRLCSRIREAAPLNEFREGAAWNFVGEKYFTGRSDPETLPGVHAGRVGEIIAGKAGARHQPVPAAVALLRDERITHTPDAVELFYLSNRATT